VFVPLGKERIRLLLPVRQQRTVIPAEAGIDTVAEVDQSVCSRAFFLRQKSSLVKATSAGK
jgi:hypothetical protein